MPAISRFLYAKRTSLRRELAMRYYNQDRTHTGRWTRERTPESSIGKDKIWS